jgi:hypothetical protein
MQKRKTNQDILDAIKRNGGPYRMHRDPSLHNTPEKTISNRSKATLDYLDQNGVSSPDKRRKGTGVVISSLAATALALSPVGDKVTDLYNDSVDRMDQNFDSHNLPPGGNPVEFRGGDAFEPGTENSVQLPEIKIEP